MVSFIHTYRRLRLKISEMLRVDDGGLKMEMVPHMVFDKARFISLGTQ